MISVFIRGGVIRLMVCSVFSIVCWVMLLGRCMNVVCSFGLRYLDRVEM